MEEEFTDTVNKNTKNIVQDDQPFGKGKKKKKNQMNANMYGEPANEEKKEQPAANGSDSDSDDLIVSKKKKNKKKE